MVQLIDSHCHITCNELYGRIDEVMEHALSHNVVKMMVMCTHFDEYERALSLQAEYPEQIDIALGFHPSDLHDFAQEDYERLEAQLKMHKISLLGEIGLDYHWAQNPSKEEQKAAFIRQIELANRYGIAISIHMRDATKDTLDILKENCRTRFIMHCFSGSKETAKIVMDMGGYISFAGPLTFKNARGLLEVPSVCDMERILTETDCPYLTPHPYRGKRNEPMYVEYTFKKLAECLDMEEAALSRQIQENYERIKTW